MRSIFVLLILVMIGLNGKGQSVTALPDSVLSQCCLEVTLLNGNVTTVDWVFVQYITRDGTGTKLFVEYAPNFGGIQWETQIRIQDDFDDVLERSKFIVIPFTVGSTDYGINRNWIANIEENTTTGGTWIYGRFGTPTKRKFSAVEDYETMKNLLLACRPRAIVVAENGLYTEGDTVRMGGFLIEPTTITAEGYNWQMKDTLSSAEFGLDYLTPETGDTTVYWGRRSGSVRQMVQMGNRYWYNTMKDTVGGLFSDLTMTWNSGDPFLKYLVFNPLSPTSGTAWVQVQRDNSFLLVSNETINPYYTAGWTVTSNSAQIGVNESGSGDPGNGVVMGAFGDGTSNEYLFMVTKAVDNNTATNGQYLQLVDNTNGKVEFATIDLSAYLPIADTAAMLAPYVDGFGTIGRIPIFTGTRTIGNSPISYNSTTKRTTWDSPGVIELPMGTDAQRPTATTSDFWYNTTGNGIEWYNGTRWAKAPEFTFNRGTQGRLPYPDANGQYIESANLTYTGTRLQTGGSLRIGYNNATNDTASIEKVIDVNSKIIRFNAPGGPGNFGGGFVFRGGQNGTINTANTFRIYAPGTTAAGSVFVGNVTEPGAQAGNPTTIFGILNKITSTTAYDAAINIHPNETGAGANYSLALGKQFGIFIGNNYANTAFTKISGGGAFGVYIGYQRQPLTSGYGSSMVFSAKGEGATDVTEVMRLQGKDGNICLGCTNAQYQLYTANTGAYGIPRGTVAQRPTIISSTTPIRYNTDSTALEYGESVGTWRQFATRAYARSLVSGLVTTNIYTANGSLAADRTLHGAGYTLRINANTIFRDSLKIGNFIEPADADSIVIVKGGWIGKQKFLLKNYRDSIYKYNSNGFFSDKFASGFKSSRNRFSNLFYADTTGFMQMVTRDSFSNLLSAVYVGINNNNRFVTLRVTRSGVLNDLALGSRGLDYSNSLFANIFGIDSSGTAIFAGYGGGTAKTLDALGKTFRSALGVATDGTMVNIETKRDTTIYVVDTDYDFSAALTTTQVSARYNRIVFLMTTTAAAGSDSELTLHTPDVNLMQCEYLVRSTDEAGGFDNKIIFGTNNAVSSTNTLATNYFPAAGQGVGVRIGLRSGVYKYYYY